ncbi:glycosyl transferase [Erythrobacter sp. Dej080120_24]|uniref:TIGR03087 family PEP-CTERM/XrtA system glycosyltransferase n=1 Tax=unclassified Erythrobacter TaxID=2633097 RepID=UPI00291D8897|nr:glycosyl transferase [Erythrobacter sp. Dej080120_24]
MGDILFLAHRIPFPPNRGDKIRAHHLLRKLARIAPVHVGCFAESDADREAIGELADIAASHRVVDRTKPLALAGVQALLAAKPVSLTAFHSARLAQWVEQTLARQPISAIVVFSGQMGQYVPDGFKGRVIIDLCDVDSAKFESYAKAGQRAWINAREARLLAREEERLAQRADATILISDNEAALFESRLTNPLLADVRVLGNGIDAQFFDPDTVKPHAGIADRKGPHFVFTGQMDYPPNEAAALWVTDTLMPRVRSEYPEAEFHVVGRNPTRALQSRSDREGITVWGEVPDVRPFVAAADVVLAPLMIARGVQNKVLEAMAMAKPALLTPEAATGIEATDGLHWMQCVADADLMAERLKTHFANDPDGMAMGAHARAFVLRSHDWDAMLAPLETLVAEAGEGARNAA